LSDRPDSETYRKANQEFEGEHVFDRDVIFEEVINESEIKEIMGNDWQSYEQYCSTCTAKNINKDFKILKAISKHNIPQKKDKQLILLMCKDCQQ
jgi:hypothetical protein